MRKLCKELAMALDTAAGEYYGLTEMYLKRALTELEELRKADAARTAWADAEAEKIYNENSKL